MTDTEAAHLTDVVAELDSVSTAYSLAKMFQKKLIREIDGLVVVNEQLRTELLALTKDKS